MSLRTITLCLVFLLFSTFGFAKSEKYRLVWNDDPATTMTIIWNQLSGDNFAVHYGESKDQSDWQVQKPDREMAYRGMENKYVRLKNLKPNSAYYFQVKDSEGSSPLFWFKTAPNTPQPFSFVAGGDSRTNKQPREHGNQLIAKIRPLFIAHGGDYLDNGTTAEWDMWLDEWQATCSEDGRMYPIIPCHGNHENDDRYMMYNIFDIPNKDAYYAISIAGNLVRLYNLNTELEPGVGYGAFLGQDDTLWKKQNHWFAKDLEEQAAKHTWVVANYHRPLRPHTSGKSEGLGRIAAWGNLFAQHGVDIGIECDTHMVKYTYPVRYSNEEGSFQDFIRDDKNGTVFLGEGSWGAPTRPTDDDKPWTLASDSFWQYKLVHVSPKFVQARTVMFGESKLEKLGVIYDPNEVTELTQEEQDKNPFALPKGLSLWKPLPGEFVQLPFTKADIKHVSLVKTKSEWRYLDGGKTPEGSWQQGGFDDKSWMSGKAELGYGDNDEQTTLSFGGNPLAKANAYFFRQSFSIANPEDVLQLNLRLLCDDGALVYLNGKLVHRYNLPANATYATKALSSINGKAESTFKEVHLHPSHLVAGDNILAISVHQSSAISSDVSLDIDLTATLSHKDGPAPAEVAGLRVQPFLLGGLLVEWNAVEDATCYRLERRKDGSDNWVVLSHRIPARDKFYLDLGLESGSSYEYRMSAINACGISETVNIMGITTAEPRPVIWKENFSSATFGQCETVSVKSNAVWEVGDRDNKSAAKVSGYGADEASDDWLLTPAIDLKGKQDPVFFFSTYCKYNGGKIEALISTDYNGDVQAASWEALTAKFPAENSRSWTGSGDIDLSNYADQKVVIAFRYTTQGIAAGQAASWAISDLKLVEDRENK